MIPSRPKRTLDPAEVDDMLSGTWQMPVTSEGAYGRARDYVPRYDRCANCGVIQPALVTFSGQSEWSPGIPLDDPLRLEIEYLRADRGRRTILLCTQCIDDLRSTGSARAADQQPPRLFAD